ncbi:ATP-binding protein [Sphingobium mellinum]|uniref:ATP-binding protein n=1 Tax=Sphingobium mellinum TaxID=1387166 RepID=UPI0030EE532B
MRFRQLELVRYGGFADRVFDFGEGRPDLHLIVGPNEAGKSTTLQAIGDFLFGIPERSAQNWRYEYGQLRLRALIEHEDDLLDVTRRKGKRDTLLKPDGTPFADDSLVRLLGGIDRAGFERMFGLDHTKLRQGGESILGGRDDAARITLEAGTGVSHIGKELSRLTDTASELFKSGGQNPPVNRLMRERSEALAQVRLTSISDAEWTQSRQRRTQAEERRTKLIEEAEALDREHARLDRVGRARAPSARLTNARSELTDLTSLPELPADAAARLTAARAERLTATELKVQVDADLLRVDAAISGVEAPGSILAQRDRIEALEERRPVIAKAAVDLERRRAELERIDMRITSTRAEARISPDVALPSAGWRKRASLHLEARRQVKSREAASLKESARLNRDRERIQHDLSALGDDAGLAALTAALALLPADAEHRLKVAGSDADRKRALAAERLANLAPWRGSAALLRELLPPTEAAAAEVRRAAETALANATAARKDAENAEASAIRAQAKLKSLIAGGTVPTADAVAAIRRVRDEHVQHVRERLVAAPSPDDEGVGREMADAIAQADQLADRRDAEATRVAEYALMIVAADEANELLTLSNKREETYRQELKQIEDSWNSRLHALGFDPSILPAELAGWLTKRAAALEAEGESTTAAQAFEDLKSQVIGARTAIAEGFAACGGRATTIDDPTLIRRVTERAAELSGNAARRINLMTEAETVEDGVAELRNEDAELEKERGELEEALQRLVLEAGLPGDADEIVVADALETLAQINEDAGARESIQRQVSGIEQDRAAFETELAEILFPIGIARRGEAVDQTRQLALSLRDAVRSEEVLATHAIERDRLITELERVQRRLDNAGVSIEELMHMAGVATDADLDQIIAGVDRREAARTIEREALAELAGMDNGAGLEALALEIASLPIEEEAAARVRIEDRRREVAAEREVVGRTLNTADDEAVRAATESAAADAQQVAADTTAALAQAAEEHIQAVTAAALLRWMLDRHRATNQAPLIARAGALFEQVTEGAFSGLTIGYANDDRPVILAKRADGVEVGVESLSEGTRDQLYLALRLGSIEGRAGAGALPIVCDDLLITADDARSAALFKVLSAAAEHSQVIVFSHHTHLIDIAKQAVGMDGFKLHMIEPASAIAA